MNRDRKRRGMVLVWTAITLMVLIGFVGLSIDWGKITLNVHQMQNAADAAALAGVLKIPDGLAAVITRAKFVAEQNHAERMNVTLRDAPQGDPFGGDESPYDILMGRYYPQFRGTPDEWEPCIDGANAVKAIVRRVDGMGDTAPPLRMVFGPIFGVQTVDATRPAIAMLMVSNGAGLICLAPTGTGINIPGTPALIVNGGDIQVNSNQEPSVDVDGGALIESLGLYTRGTVESPTTYDFPVVPHTDWMDDPVAWVPDLGAAGGPPMPELGTAMKWDAATGQFVDAGVDVANEIIDSGVIKIAGGFDPDNAAMPMLRLTPGYYPKGINLSNGAKLVLDRGVYAVGGNKGTSSGLVATGGTLLAEGVMVYVTEDGDGNWGEISLNGNGAEIHISEYVSSDLSSDPYAPYSYAGLAIMQDRRRPEYKGDMDPSQPFFAGGNQSSFEGTVYLHQGVYTGETVDPDTITGDYTTVPRISGGAGSIGIQVITDRLIVTGNGDVIINYDGRNKWIDADIAIVK